MTRPRARAGGPWLITIPPAGLHKWQVALDRAGGEAGGNLTAGTRPPPGDPNGPAPSPIFEIFRAGPGPRPGIRPVPPLRHGSWHLQEETRNTGL